MTRSLAALAVLRSDEARLDEAEKLAREAVARGKARLPVDDPALVTATTALGKVLEARGDYAKAIPVLEEAVTLAERIGQDAPEVPAALTELANCHFYAGHFEVSRAVNTRALALHRKLYGDQHPLVSSDLFNLGGIESDLGNYPQAEAYYRQGLAITESWYQPNHPQIAADLMMLVRVLTKTDRTDEALLLATRALEIRERVNGKVHPMVASVVNDLGLIALTQHRPQDAKGYFERVVSIYRSVYKDRPHYLVGLGLVNLSHACLQAGDPTRAEALVREALGVYGVTLAPEHLRIGIARTLLGRIFDRQQRYPEALEESAAGYAILKKQTNPNLDWLKRAREDLADEHERLHQPVEAAQFRLELASTK